MNQPTHARTPLALHLVALVSLCLLAAGLRLYALGATGYGNGYYAATVKSMLTSWHNFFFVSFEPGGSVTVDKPPLGFWIQAASAAVLGVSGFSLALPQALAGIATVALTFWLVRRALRGRPGESWAPILAGLVVAVAPVSVATERNNTIDGLLLPLLLLAAWATLRALETGRGRWLICGALLIGLAFEVKMMQAFLPVPAFFGAYLLFARTGWLRRIAHLTAATAVMLTVSLAWPLAVDLTPANARPFIGSTTENSVFELIMGHNGLRRLGSLNLGGNQPGQPPQNGQPGQPPQNDQPGQPPQNDQPGQPPQNGQPGQPPQNGQPGQPPQNGQPGQPPQNGQPGQPPQNGQPGQPPQNGQPDGPTSEIGTASPWRLFTEPLAGQMSWFLPMALLGLLAAWGLRLSGQTNADTPASTESAPHTAGVAYADLFLWSMWLITELVFFSIAQLFHRYYLIMLVPPAAALIGLGLAALWQAFTRPGLAGWLLPLALALSALQQGVIVSAYPSTYAWAIPLVILTGACTLVCIMYRLWILRPAAEGRPFAGTGLLVALTLTLCALPFSWSAITALYEEGRGMLPSASPTTGGQPNGNPAGNGAPIPGAPNNDGAPPPGNPAGNGAPIPGAPNNDGAPPPSNPAGNGAPFPGAPNNDGAPPPGNPAGNGAPFPGAPNNNGAPPPGGPGPASNTVNQSLLTYVEARTPDNTYLLATLNANQASPYILATGRPVLALGGFSGGDPIFTPATIAAKVSSGELRFFLLDAGRTQGQQAEILTWVTQHCTDVSAAVGLLQGQQRLYECR